MAPTILWLRIGNTSRRALLEWVEPLLPKIEAMLREGERLIEVRSPTHILDGGSETLREKAGRDPGVQ